MRTVKSIIDNTRFALVTLICTLTRKFEGYLETGRKNLMVTRGACVDFNGLNIADKTPLINVEVGNSYLDVEDKRYEPRHIDYIVARNENDFYLTAGETDIDADDISTDELVAIAEFLENTYKEI